MNQYNPLLHPFELPVQKLFFHCIPEQPIYLPPNPGDGDGAGLSTPGTTLSGAFGRALWPTVCERKGECYGKADRSEPVCSNPSQCAAAWLYRPYSEVHKRKFARPVLLRAPLLEGMLPVAEFVLEAVLWGRHAVTMQREIVDTVKQMGLRGLGGDSVRFQVADRQAGEVFTLAQYVEHYGALNRVLLEFQTPFILRLTERAEGRKKPLKYYYTGEGPLPLGKILGNAAYELAAWDMEDRNLGEALSAKERHNLARDARDAAEEAATDLFIVRADLGAPFIGERFSRSHDGSRFPLPGFIGLVELAGELDAALPWLAALTFGRGGQDRPMGFGVVKLWRE